MFKIILPILMVLVGSLTMVGEAKACSCGDPGPVDGAYEQSPNVVILKLQSLEKYPDAPTEDRYSVGNIKRSILTVEKVFKGKLKVGQELLFRQGGGADCVWTFSEESIGNEYLLYLDAKPGKDGLWTGHVCSRSGSTKYRSSDLLYLEKLPKVLGKTRISGKLFQEITTAVKGGYAEDKLLPGRFVWITGNEKNIKLETDRNGVYEVYDLPPGKYKITPEKVPGYKFSSYSDKKTDFVEIDLKEKSHAEMDFDFEIDNLIQGKFFDAKGNVLRGVCMDLVPASGELAPYTYLGDCTEDGGVFEFSKVPAGTYILVINAEDKVTASEPFGRFYYPNKQNREDATEINIGPGEYQTNLIIIAPDTAETVLYSGRLLFEDGKPVPDESVLFYKDSDKPRVKDYNPDSRTRTNENGEFTLKILKGSKGYIYGSMTTYSGEYEKCPKLEKLIKASGETRLVLIDTPDVRIDPITDFSGIELRLPFPLCKPAKID
jgi:hypothetical protein